MLLIKQGTSLWYLRDQCWRALQQMFYCTRCSWMSAPSGCSSCQQSQRERVEQWVFWDLSLCSRSGRYAYHQTGDGVIAPRKSQWSKYSQNPRPGSRLTGGSCCCNNQPEGTLSVLSRLGNIWRVYKPGPSWANVSRFYGTDVDTIVLPSNVRLPCMLPAPWTSVQTLQGTWMSLMSRDCCSSFQQENSAFYPHSMATISHTISHSM